MLIFLPIIRKKCPQIRHSGKFRGRLGKGIRARQVLFGRKKIKSSLTEIYRDVDLFACKSELTFQDQIYRREYEILKIQSLKKKLEDLGNQIIVAKNFNEKFNVIKKVLIHLSSQRTGDLRKVLRVMDVLG